MPAKVRIVHVAIFLCCLYAIINQCSSKRKLFISWERPVVDYYNPKYVGSLKVQSRRLSRSDPINYVTVNITTLVDFDRTIKVNISCFERLSNTYKRSFVEWSLNGCDLLEYDVLIGTALRNVYSSDSGVPLKCPVPPGNYTFKNMVVTFSSLLENFPFQEGRLFMSVTRKQELGGAGHIDFQIKSYNAEKQTVDNTKNR